MLELKNHKEEHKLCQGKHKCEECDKSFKDKTQLETHVKRVHVKYECDECDKVFQYEILLERHIEAAHEDVEIYCHFFNNDKECPHLDNCIFIHEESESYKYGKGCERKMCMFRHESSEEDDSENDESEDVESGDEGKADNLKPSLDKVKKCIEKVTALLEQVCPVLKCSQCEFEAKDKNGLNLHNKAKHNNKS